jgi:hypothetical protein
VAATDTMLRRKLRIIETLTIESLIVGTGLELACEICGPDSDLMSLAAAKWSSGFTYSRILEMVEGRSVHLVETTDGHLLICRNSIDKIKTP